MESNKINDKKIGRKGQTFSADIMVVIVILLFGALFLLMNNLDNDNVSKRDVDTVYEQSSEDSKLIFEELKTKNYLDQENNVNLKELQTIDVNKIKEDLNIKGKFCIVFEKDGNLVKIDPENNVNGIGDSEIIVNDVPCTMN